MKKCGKCKHFKLASHISDRLKYYACTNPKSFMEHSIVKYGTPACSCFEGKEADDGDKG